MFNLKNISIKSKLQTILLLVSFSTILGVGYLSWYNARTKLEQTIFNKLTNIRNSKTYQIESYFQNLYNQVETLCEDQMMISAMTEFNVGYEELEKENKNIPPQWEEEIKKYYQKEYLPKLGKYITGTPKIETYIPQTKAAKYLQYNYIANNPYAEDKKDQLINPPTDKSNYGKFHQKYHLNLRKIVKKFGYNNLLLINIQTGNIVYTVSKKTDFATNIETGVYNQSNLAEIVKKIKNNPDPGAVYIIDFKEYRPNYMKPTAFMAGTIYDGSKLIGILVIEIPSNQIDNVLTSNKNWTEEGLGKTGETYLVGNDLLMRSDSRILLQNPSEYQRILKENGLPSNISRLIYQLNTSIIFQKVNNNASANALKGITGIEIVKNYYNQTVISAYAPVKINGLNWVMLTEIELEEAYNPIDKIQKYILICLVISLVIITFVNRYIADYFVRPINQILDNARLISAGNENGDLVVNSRDELREIAEFFNTAIEVQREQEELLQQKNQGNENLLLNILPASVVQQIKQGTTQIAEQFQQITMMVMTLGRFEQLTNNKNAIETTNLINKLIDMIDETTLKYDVEKIKTYADQYVAVCGLSKTYLNHTKRIVDCALEITEIIHKFNEDYGTKINFCIGIQTGVMFGSIIGKKKFTYELWGENVTIANHLSRYGEIDAICVSQAVYNNLHEMYNFYPGKEINIPHLGNIQTWVLRKQWLQKLILDLTEGLDFDDIN